MPGITTATHDWELAGKGWGHDARNWSCLYEHYAMDVLLAISCRLGLGPGIRLLDVACGAGLGVRLAAGTGAEVAGIDAAEALLDVARDRTPGADLRLGSMFELPWPDARFDRVMSINGIWGGCAGALDEAHRVLRPGGTIGISFWGPGPPMDIRDCFRAFAAHAPSEHRRSMRQLNDIGAPGVAVDMLTTAGFEVLEEGARVSVVEWPDADLAWRAVSSVGPAVPALAGDEADLVREEVMRAIDAWRDERGTYRSRSDHRFVIARKSP
jgi:SAM-dependent methyltransferase